MVVREQYIKKIQPFMDKPVVKVITGIRRSGKSELMKMLQGVLTERGVRQEQIVYINYESLRWEQYRDYRSLYNYVDEVRSKLNGQRIYVFVDEIQEVEEWERAVNSMLADWDADIYITGSNSRLLSSELASYLAGRYVECVVYPLSYSEFLKFHNYSVESPETRLAYFEQYLRQGGFPAFHVAPFETDTIYQMVQDIYASVLLRDTVQRFRIRNIDMLDRLVQFLFDNIGNTFSAKSITAYLKNQKRTIDAETLYNYLQALESSFIISKVQRYDTKGKELLQTGEKYYVADLSLIYARRGYAPELIAGMLENLVYVELLRRGYRVFVGKQGKAEVDFIGVRQEETVYVQVCESMDSDATRERELKPLREIKDNYPKYIVLGTPSGAGNIEGIQCRYIGDFLLEQ